MARYKISGHSMLPTLKPGQVVWVLTWAFIFSLPKRGDIVVFSHQGQDLIKRVSSVNALGLELIGDNPHDSLDSRHFGSIKPHQVLGKVIFLPKNMAS